MKKEIVRSARINIGKSLPIKISWKDYKTKDAELNIHHNGDTVRFATSARKVFRLNDLYANLDFNGSPDSNKMILAERITPQAKSELVKSKISYLEANGNILIDLPGLFVMIDQNKPQPINQPKENRAFTKTGLKVVFHLLLYFFIFFFFELFSYYP
jgi:hypothetical protein